MSQLHFFSRAELAALQPPTKVGGWKIDRHSKCFEFVTYQYRVDFAQCNDPLKLLDWVLHLHDKQWGRESIGDFIEVVRSVFGSSVHPGCQSSMSGPAKRRPGWRGPGWRDPARQS